MSEYFKEYSNPETGISGYKIKGNSLTVRFKDNAQYTYNKADIGGSNFNKMSNLGESQKGLNRFIMVTPKVKYGYRRKQF